MRILALDTATENCSVALWVDGQVLLRELETPRGHADLVLEQVDVILAEGGLALRNLDAIAFGRGPGSFTGVRLAASVTQGLAWGAGIPVVAVSDLQAVAQRLVPDKGAGPQRVLVCNDARMSEVYWGCFEADAQGLAMAASAERVGSAAEVQLPTGWQQATVIGAGRGFAAYPELGRAFAALHQVDDRVLPRAVEVARLAVPEVQGGRTVKPQEAVPVYLRNEVARPAVPPVA